MVKTVNPEGFLGSKLHLGSNQVIHFLMASISSQKEQTNVFT